MFRGSHVVTTIAAAATLAGCFHTELQAPPRDAPVAARVAAYEQLRATGQIHTITMNQSGTQTNHEIDLVTASGVTVRHAEDLLPVLDETSAAARTARESASAGKKKWVWMAAGTAAMVVGFVVMKQGFDENIDDLENSPGDGKIKWGIGIALGGGLAGSIGWYYHRHVEITNRAATFANYDDGLRARLELCVDGLQLVDCDRPSASSLR